MRNIVVSVAFVLASAASLCAWPASAGSSDELTAAKAAIARRDYDAAERSAGVALAAGDLKGEDLATAYFIRGYARVLASKLADAVSDFTDGLKSSEKGGNAWATLVQARSVAYFQLSRWSDAAGDFVALAKERPAAARSIRYKMLSRMVWELEKSDEDACFNVLKAMRDVSYVPEEPGENLDYLTHDFVQMLVERGEDLVAMMELSKIKTADLLVEARVDRRYASLWNKKDFDEITDPNETAAREVAHVSELAKRYPNIAIVMMRYVKALRIAGESEKAVEMAREALANPALTSANADRAVEDKLWLRNELVYALKDLGRTDEMFAEMQPVLKLDEAKNGVMVSELINFGEIMIELDRGAEGVKTAQRGWNIASPLGKMFIHMIEVCGNAETDKPAADKALALLRKEQSENYPALTAALLCMDRTDEAASLVKKRLSLSPHRGAVLSAVQSYKLPPFVSPMRRKMMERYAKVIARSDIQVAIKKYGRVESFPFVASYWGKF